HKMEIRNANFELRNAGKIISAEPILTKQQIELALFLGQYYFCSPGLFAKMMLACRPARQNINADKSLNKNETPEKIAAKPQKLILVPTVSQTYSFRGSHPPNSVIWHSELTQKQKNTAWLAVKSGQAQIVIGTRSAVFLPFTNLKKIIIEEESNSSHKSWNMFPYYDSRLVAQKLAEIFKAKLTQKSDVPAITAPTLSPSFKEGEIKRGELLFHIIDMRQELKGGNFSIFSVDLYEAVKDALAAKKQIILFINRRGTANFILCRDCGYIAKCPNCDTPLAHHLINNKPSLLCHRCGAKDAPPSLCPKCKSWRIKTVGSGAQKVEAETKKFFPDAKILRLDSDIASNPKDQQKIIADFTDKKTDVLIATQIIFSWLAELTAIKPAVIGILSADTLLHIPDFRSGERTWQIIAALQNLITPSFVKEGGGGFKSPRKGAWPPRGFTPFIPLYKEGENRTLFIQTYNPDNSVLKYAKNNDYAGFAKQDMEAREALNYPPFSQIVKLTFRHRDPKTAGQEAKILAAKLENVISTRHSKLIDADNIEISSALPAFIPRAKGKFIWSVIIKFKIAALRMTAQRAENLKFKINNEFLQKRNSLLQYVPQNWEIDIDPENLL
ncbi:MAG: primosomal protein N', partial [bacterium]